MPADCIQVPESLRPHRTPDSQASGVARRYIAGSAATGVAGSEAADSGSGTAAADYGIAAGFAAGLLAVPLAAAGES
jgi:hypothetical protein